MPKADLSNALASAGGSARRRPQPAPVKEDKATQPSRLGTSPITAHFPKEVRNQLKILAVEQDTTMHRLIAEAFNDLFAKYGKPEIAPMDGGKE
jgi:hypothetical protein